VGAVFEIAQAGIAGISYFSAGVKYTLTDGTGSIILLLWQNVLEDLRDRYDLVPGSQVRVRGRIEEYQGDLEIIPQDASSVIIVTRGERSPIEERAVSGITPSDEGRVFVVEGTVARTEVHDWLYLWIHDGTGEILIYAPERVVQYMPTGVTAGTRLRVTGEVDIYKGVLEIIPLAAADIEVR
jgi:DNA/RNA endonuclease YhcR with UshA esterase domain